METVIGIDLGTTNSVVSTVLNGRVDVIPDPQGRRLHPSVVAFLPSGDVVVGHAARARRHIDPVNTIYSAKRLIGHSIHNPVVQLALPALPYRVEEGPNEQPLIVVRGRQYTVPEISALILGHLKQCAERHLGQVVSKAVITVPANFTDAQRQATKHAGELAGLKVLRILNEPTAAALAYGFGKSLDARLAIYDLGGGTFDVTVLAIRDKIFEVLATGGDSFLGGDDFDRALVGRLAARFLDQTKIDLRRLPDAWAKLTVAAEQIRCQLSRDDAVAGTVHELTAGADGRPVDLSFDITRQELEAVVNPFVERSLLACDEVLAASGLSAAGLTELILVGGATRTPLLRRRIVEHFRREPQTRINPDETVAYGAALQAAALTVGAQNPAEFYSLLLDVVPRALGIAVAGGYAEPIIERNTPIPVERARRFLTSHDNQTHVVLQVCQGESRRFADNALLGTLTLEGIPARPRGEGEIEVAFMVDTDGILNVHARDMKTGLATQARIQVVGAPELARFVGDLAERAGGGEVTLASDTPSDANDPGHPPMSAAARAAIREWIEQQHGQLERVSYYQLLDVPRDAAEDVVRTAYYHLVARFHPDLYGENLDESTRAKLVTLYSRLVEAYQCLVDGEKRTQYAKLMAEGKLRWSAGDHQRQHNQETDIQNPSARRFLKLGQAALKAGDAKAAIMNFKLALSVVPRSPILLAELARAEAVAKGKA